MADQNPVVPAPAEASQPKGRRPSRRKDLLATIAGLLLLVPVSYYVGRAGWRRLRVVRARTQAQAANQLLHDQKFTEAQRVLRTAIEMAPNDPEVLRLTAEWCTQVNSPDGLIYWDRLAQLVPPTRADLLKKLDLSLALQRLDISRDLLKRLLSQDARDRELLVRAIQFHRQTGQMADAIQVARMALATLPSDSQIQLLLGELLTESTDANARKEARQLLWSVALDNSPWRAAAVDQLAQNRDLSRDDRLLLIHTLEARQPVALSDRLLALTLRLPLATQPEEVWRRADILPGQFPGLTNQIDIALWLAGAGATPRSVALIPSNSAATNAYAAFGTLEILIRAREWPRVHSLIQQDPVALPSSAKEAALGVIAAATGTATDATGYFANAIQKAAGRPVEMILVANYAELAQQPALAAQALLQAAELNPSLTITLCRRAIHLLTAIDDTAISRRIIEKLADYLPREPSMLLERSWLDALFNEQLPRARSSLSQITNHPAVGQDARVTLALVDFRRGESGSALAQLEGLGVDPNTLAPRLRAAYATILQANQQREAARRLAQSIPAGKLSSKEAELLTPIR